MAGGAGGPTSARLSRRWSTSWPTPQSAAKKLQEMNAVARIVAEAEAATLERRVHPAPGEAARPGEALLQLLDPHLFHGLPERRRRALLDQVEAMEAADYDLRHAGGTLELVARGGAAAGSPAVFRGTLRTGESFGIIGWLEHRHGDHTDRRSRPHGNRGRRWRGECARARVAAGACLRCFPRSPQCTWRISR